ncbi:MAG: glycosyltransferase family 25 protein [Thalassovita sp.]
MSSLSVPVIVISLERAVERLKSFDSECANLGITYSVFTGVDGKAEYETLLQKTDVAGWKRHMGAPLSAGHLGCYASHVQLWSQIGEGADDIVLVCEDDVVFHDDFPKAVQAALKASEHWDICRFAKIRAKGAITQGTVDGYRLNAYWGPFTGNACYLIKRDLAKRLARGFWPISRAHDHELNRFFHYDFRLMGLEPFAAHPDDKDESYITGTGMQDAKKFPKYKRLPYYRQKFSNYFRRLNWLRRHGALKGSTDPIGR